MFGCTAFTYQPAARPPADPARMRPLDTKNAASHATYEATFATILAGGLGVVVFTDYAKEAEGDGVYEFFRRNLTWSWSRKKNSPVPKGVPVGTVGQVLVEHMPASFTLAAATRDGLVQPITVQAYIQQYQQLAALNDGKGQVLRVVLPHEVASDLLRLAREDAWNGTQVLFPGTTPTARVQKQIIEALTKGIGLVEKPPVHAVRYGDAKDELVKACGGFCSYCEGPYQNPRDMAVEHRIPKSDFVTETLRWDNFVLACNLCNSDSKRTAPPRAFGLGALVKAWNHANGGNPIQYAPTGGAKDHAPERPPGSGTVIPYHEILKAAADGHLWPDVKHTLPAGTQRALSLRMIDYQLWSVDDQGAYGAHIPTAWAVHASNAALDTAPDQWLRANVWNVANGSAGLKLQRVAVRPVVRSLAETDNTLNDRLNAAAPLSIALFKLDERTKPCRDQRVMGRTRVWFKALTMVRLLQDQLQTLAYWTAHPYLRRLFGWLGIPVLVVEAPWELVLQAAEADGYYSVWLHVFKHVGGDPLATALATRLQTRAAADPHATIHYHGTDVQGSVAPFISEL